LNFDSLLINHAKVVQVAVDAWSEPTKAEGQALPHHILYGDCFISRQSSKA